MRKTREIPSGALPEIVIVFVLMLLSLVATPSRADTVIDWSEAKNGKHTTYNLGEVTLTLSSVVNESGESPRLDIKSSDGAKVTLFGTSQSHKSASIRVTRVDPKHSQADVMFGSYSGGAHCCMSLKIASLVDGSWRVVDLGKFDGEGDGIDEPQQLDGDGDIGLILTDDSFLYAFAGYAEGAARPIKIIRVDSGKTVDMTRDPAVKHLVERNMEQNRDQCARGANSGCAAYVADAANLGMFPVAWQFMLSHYDKKSDWQLEFCDVLGQEDKCTKQVKFSSFPQALDWFLRKHGYLPEATAIHVPAETTRDPILLACRFDNGRTIGGVVVFRRLKKLRIWYGDGGGEEWTDVNYSNDPILTTTNSDERSIVLSGDLTKIIFNNDAEHAFGECHVRSAAKAPLWWFNPVLKQEWEYDSR